MFYWDKLKTHLIQLFEVSFLCISDFSNCELIALSSSLAIAISSQCSKDDMIVLAAFFTTLGDNLALLSL